MRFCYHCMTPIEDKYITNCPACGKSMKPCPMDSKFLPPGTELGGRFIVGYPLGAGGFGNTYIGWNKVLLRKVAIKEFYPYRYVTRGYDGYNVFVKNEQFMPRFQNGIRNFLEEARKVASLKDVKGIVNIMNFFEENHTAYIVMEFLEGKSLKSVLRENDNRLSYEKSREITLSILYTLKEVHRKNVLHRDIAPDNVMITKDGMVKLIDFGAAKHALAMDDARSELVLKHGYAPIEQYIRNSAQGSYTDLYEVAALFYRMLTGQTPLPANQRQKDPELILPSQMGISIPRGVEQAICTCLEMYPPKRLQRAEDFIRLLNGESFVPKNVTSPYTPLESTKDKPVKEFPVTARILIAAVVVVIVICSIAIPVALRTADNTTQTMVSEADGLEDFTGYTVEEVKDRIKNSKYDISLMTMTQYTTQTEKDQQVFEQFPKATNDLGTDLPDGWEMQDGKIKGTLTLSVYSAEEISYREMKKLNAYSFAQICGADLETDNRFEAVDEAGTYFSIIKIKMADGREITEESLRRDEEESLITVADIETIYYRAEEFFYWKAMKDFVGKDIAQVKENTYRLESEGAAPVSTGKKKALVNTKLVDMSYYSFEDEAGYIFAQTKKPGETVDTSSLTDEPIFLVVGEKLSYQNKTGKELGKDLIEKGFSKIQYTGSGLESEKVEDVTVFLPETGEKLTQFSVSQEPVIEIKTKEKAVPQPQPQPQPVPPPVAPQPEIFFESDFNFNSW